MAKITLPNVREEEGGNSVPLQDLNARTITMHKHDIQKLLFQCSSSSPYSLTLCSAS